jgi:hypothetical protein
MEKGNTYLSQSPVSRIEIGTFMILHSDRKSNTYNNNWCYSVLEIKCSNSITYLGDEWWLFGHESSKLLLDCFFLPQDNI